MPRLITVALAAVLGLFTQPAHNAWVFVVDDLHIGFVQTGRLRDLLRVAAGELIQQGDRFLLRASGPSAMSLSNAMAADRESIAPAIRMMTGNGLKESDIALAPSKDEVIHRANVALDAADGALTALAAEAASRKAIIIVSWGYDIDAHASLAARVSAFIRRARENGITIFAVDSRGLEAGAVPEPLVDAVAWQRYKTSTRRSLSLITEGTGGFVIDNANEPSQDLKRIGTQMR
jgi:hypothetical protein